MGGGWWGGIELAICFRLSQPNISGFYGDGPSWLKESGRSGVLEGAAGDAELV